MSKLRVILIVVAVLAGVSSTGRSVAGDQVDLCTEPWGSPVLCARVPAIGFAGSACVAVGIAVLTGGWSPFSRSITVSNGGPRHQEMTMFGTPPNGFVEADAVTSVCDATALPTPRSCGHADLTNVHIDLSPRADVVLDVMRGSGCSDLSGASNRGSVGHVSLVVAGQGFDIPASAPKNTHIDLGPLGSVTVNEEFVASNVACRRSNGAALHLKLSTSNYREILLGWVSTMACNFHV